jgi:hypothetical protein
MVPDSVAPEAGEVIDTVGGVLPDVGWVLTVPAHPETIAAKTALRNHAIVRVLSRVEFANHACISTTISNNP